MRGLGGRGWRQPGAPRPAATMGAWCHRALGWGCSLRATFERQAEDSSVGEAGARSEAGGKEAGSVPSHKAIMPRPRADRGGGRARSSVAAWAFTPQRASPGWKDQAMAWALQNQLVCCRPAPHFPDNGCVFLRLLPGQGLSASHIVL